MADYYSPTVIQPTIPEADMTPLERLLLTQIFSAEPDGDGVYFYAEEGPVDFIVLSRVEIVNQHWIGPPYRRAKGALTHFRCC